jgi:hypothetical protein
MGTNVNFGEILPKTGASSNSGDYPPIPEGDYDFSVVSANVKTSQSGKPMISVKAQVEGGPYDRRYVWDNLVVTKDNPKALGILQGKLNALGFTPEYLKEHNPDLETIADYLVNRNFRAKVAQSEYMGKMRNEIKAYIATTPASAVAAAAPAAAPAPPAAPPQAAAGAAIPAPPPAPSGFPGATPGDAPF